MKQPIVSVCMITYNHEKYIEQAILGVLKQETSFQYDLVIADDASNDGSKKLIEKYRHKYPQIVRFLSNTKNLGMMKNYVQALHACTGYYTALCEGDDYWTDKHKLQIQVDYLNKHNEYSISSHNVEVVNEDSGKRFEWLGKSHQQTSTIRDLLKYGSGGATCSLLFKTDLMRKLPSWFDSLEGGDWVTQILCAKQGKLKYFPELMAVYRKHKGGVSHASTLEDYEKIYLNGGILMCDKVDKYLNYQYTKELLTQKVNYYYPILLKLYKRYGKDEKAMLYAKKILHNYLLFKRKSLLNFVALTRDAFTL